MDAYTEEQRVLFDKKLRSIAAKWHGAIEEPVLELALRMKTYTLYCLLLGMVGTACNAYSNEKLWWSRFDLDEKPQEEDMINLLKNISAISTIVNIFFLTRYHVMQFQVLQFKKNMVQNSGWSAACASTFWVGLLWDVALSAVQPVPYVNRVYFTVPAGLAFQDCKYNMDVLLVILMFICRVNLIWRCTVAYSRFWLQRSLFVPTFTLVDPSNLYVIYRYYHHLYPVRLHLGSYLVYLIGSGYLLYIFERAALDWHLTDEDYGSKAGAPSDDTPITFWNCVWLQFVTAGTVGYGQYLVHTFVGRAMAVVTVVTGVAYIGLVVSAVEGTLQLNREEEKVLNAMEDRHNTDALENHAARLIQRSWMVCIQAKEAGVYGEPKREYMSEKLDRDIQIWKGHRKEFMLFKSNAVDVDSMLEKLHRNAGKSHAKHRLIDEAIHAIGKRQDTMQHRQEKVEQQLVLLASRLHTLADFFRQMA